MPNILQFREEGLNLNHVTHWFDQGEIKTIVVYFVNGRCARYRLEARRIILDALYKMAQEIERGEK